MSLRSRIQFARQAFFYKVELFFQFLASSFGFPENPGMPIVPQTIYFWNQPNFNEDFPIHKKGFPVPQQPSTLFEALFGDFPKINLYLIMDVLPVYL